MWDSESIKNVDTFTLREILDKNPEYAKLMKTKFIPLLSNIANRLKCNEKRLIILEEKINMLYEIMIRKD